MLLRFILAILGIAVIGYSIYGVKNGKLHMRGFWADKTEKPWLFWLMVVIYLGFGGMLLYFSIWGKFGGK
ncbi:MAG TPA: hypothetical protein ENH14_01270 [candidate division WOR-3 bacterium]|uniref:Uncharacterized protein n=1 Tax=candidate division WOR-3 bacterium TaxID=2052148 RepID=A0A7V0Q747_UNCW3|nr:hypothetical protein [Candidatus Hydrothermae bacterium]HDL60065.1 hypothetical protein [candidate division WOR-3 bacterium]